jgi:hypothetical protein
MKSRELVSRCFRARVVSWLTASQQGVVLPSVDGSPCIIAVYSNGRYVTPETITIPNGVPPEWGPDGPVQQPPADSPDAPGEGDDGAG